MSSDEHIRAYVANDNVPPENIPRGDAVGFNAILRERQIARRRAESLVKPDTEPSRVGLWVSIIVWAAFSIGLFWSFYSSQTVGIRIVAAIGLVWSSLWTRFCALDQHMTRLAEICVLVAFAAFVSLLTTASTQLGYPLSLETGLFFSVVAALIVSFLNGSKVALMCAIGCGLIWAALHLDGYIDSGNVTATIPALWATMIWQSIRLKSRSGALISLLVGYVWLTGNAFQALNDGRLSLLYLAAGTTVIGTLHYRAAKAAGDEGMKGTTPHVIIGFLIANFGLLLIGKFALDPSIDIWRNSHANDAIIRLSWLAISGAALFFSFLAGLIRRKHNRMKLAGVVMNTLLLGLIPVGVWFEPVLDPLSQSTFNISVYPAIGLFIFGVVTANLIFFIANAFRRAKYWQVLAAILFSPALLTLSRGIDLVDQENWVLWLLGFLAGLVVILLAVEPQLDTSETADFRQSVSSS